MALGEPKKAVNKGNKITEVSWTGGTSQDVYYGIDNSFQYSENINTDDEMHGIKLSTRAVRTDKYAKCQLVSLGKNGVMALPVDTDDEQDQVFLKRFEFNGYYENPQWTELNIDAGTTYWYNYDAKPGVVFQDRFWFGYNKDGVGYMASVACNSVDHATSYQKDYLPYDHDDYTDEDIESEAPADAQYMMGNITAILNYNNTRLVVAAGQDIWVYYPELDGGGQSTHGTEQFYGTQGWKKVLTYEAGVVVVALTCTFEYLKVWAVDEGWNTKVYYYQGNNNLRSTFVYNVVDLTGVRVLHVYSINGIDYYTSSIGNYAKDVLIDFNKMVGATPVKLFGQRAGMTVYDVNNKAPYFVGPTSIGGAYNNGHIYVADAYGVFSFKYTPNGYDKGYMKWKLRERNWYYDEDDRKQPIQIYGLCENKGILYVSDSLGCRAMRLYDTGFDGYQDSGILISREFEGKEGGTITKMLDEIRLNFELNPLTDQNGDIFVFVSPNNLRRSTHWDLYADRGAVQRESSLPSSSDDVSINDFYWVTNESAYYVCTGFDSHDRAIWEKQESKIVPGGWYQVMSITQTSAGTRTEKSQLVNPLGPNGQPAFQFDWQTITYAIVIRRGNEEQATPIVRQIDLKYHCKDKVNNVYDIN